MWKDLAHMECAWSYRQCPEHVISEHERGNVQQPANVQVRVALLRLIYPGASIDKSDAGQLMGNGRK